MRELKFNLWDIDREQYFIDVLSLESDKINKWGTLEIRTSNNVKWLQYTGLKDKNGKDIFEGDIVQLLSGRKTAIEFINSGFGYYSEFEKDTFIGFSNHNNFEIIMKYIKVIGNIHQNPELLAVHTAVL